MTSHLPSTELLARIDRLEARCSRLRLVTLGLAGLLAGTWLVAAAPPPSEDPADLAVRSLRVVGEDGQTSLLLGRDGSGRGSLAILGPGEIPVAWIGVAPDGSGALGLRDAGGHAFLDAGANVEGDGGLRVESREGTRVFYLGHDLRGNGIVPADAHAGARVGP